jgi:uroporphyrinogen III methyltransferase/synthase
MKKGKVYLIGAGPGDPGLITLRGIEYLRRADVVIFDQLIGGRVLEDYASPSAEKIFVGKTGKRHFAEQAQINAVLVQKARQGKMVARLKGGDPFVFGRGGEEADFLREHDIEYEIVPGITSAISVPTYAGIPVTHRGLSSSLAIVTGHEDPLKKGSSINWRGLATGADTLVFLMGMQNLSQIAAKLMESGRAGNEPVAVIKDGTLPTQKIVTGTLGTIAARAKKEKMTAPAVIIVGEVVKLRKRLSWFDTMPLFGKRVLVTRASLQSKGLEQLLIECGAHPVLLPVIEIKPILKSGPLDNAVKRVRNYNWLVFTSVNGVELLFNKLYELGLDARALADVKIGVIGPATCESLRKHGINADYIPETYTGRGFISGMKKLHVKGQMMLLLRADIADDEITSGLRNLGAVVDEFAIYRTVKPKRNLYQLRKLVLNDYLDVITFTSSSTVTNFLSEMNSEDTSKIKARIACIGPKTAATARKAGLKVHILARTQTIPGLIQAMQKYFQEEK